MVREVLNPGYPLKGKYVIPLSYKTLDDFQELKFV